MKSEGAADGNVTSNLTHTKRHTRGSRISSRYELDRRGVGYYQATSAYRGYARHGNDRTAVYDFVSSFRGWGDAAQCAILVIGHLPKSAEGRTAGFSGSTAWEASARAMWKLASKQDDPKAEDSVYFSLEQTKSNYAPLQKERYLVKSHYGWWREVETKDEAVKGYTAYQEGLEDTDGETLEINL